MTGKENIFPDRSRNLNITIDKEWRYHRGTSKEFKDTISATKKKWEDAENDKSKW